MSDIDERIQIAKQLRQSAKQLRQSGKIDHEAMQNLMERLHSEKQHLMDMDAKNKRASDMEDAMRNAMPSGQTRARRPTPSWEEKLCMRMGWHDVKDVPKTIRLSILNSGPSIFMTVVSIANDEAVVIKDDPLMFPSDTVVTQLRMICGA